MCPACYINGFIFLIFGASGAAIASNPFVMFIAAILTLVGFYWMWKAWKKRIINQRATKDIVDNFYQLTSGKLEQTFRRLSHQGYRVQRPYTEYFKY